MLQHPFGKYTFQIRSYDSDQQGRLTLPALFHFLQECAWENARANDFGYEFLAENNAFWVLSRVLLQMDEYPLWRDEIEIKTWPKGVDRFFAVRDFQIFKNGKTIGKVTSYWLIVDRDKKRPRRPDDFNFVHENFLKESAIEQKPGKVDLPENLQRKDQRKVFSSDMDVNRHVNNATYVRWILDSWFAENNAAIAEFEINFLSELMLNDEFLVFAGKQEENYYYALGEPGAKAFCTARLKPKNA
ncbi:MAG: acyl-ACP thioesterase domain-containing protein [Bacteroidales bacterium]|jgi:acyl-ACP thioesterase|nr:acyl-ACP thioesterase domain-containing protein [Bacteroidales bacterium]